MLTGPTSYLNGTKAGKEDGHWTHKPDGDPTADEKSGHHTDADTHGCC